MKYLDSSVTVDQKILVEEYKKIKEFKSISYESLKDTVLIPKFGSKFCFIVYVYPRFEDWKLAVQKYVCNDLPPLVSVWATGGFHMNVILGFTDLLFLAYDPATGCKPVSIEKYRGNNQPDILVIKRRSRSAIIVDT